jgi:hypothetical protein
MPPHIVIPVFVGLLLVIAVFWARQTGRLRSRAASIVLVVIIGMLAAMVWLTPIIPVVDRHVDRDGLPGSGR